MQGQPASCLWKTFRNRNYLWYIAIAQAGCVAWRLQGKQRWLRRVTILAVAELLGILMAAVQIIPSVDQVTQMVRAHVATFNLQFSMHPANLLQFCSPYLFNERYYADNRYDGNTHGMGLYTGAFCTVALAWLWMRRRDLEDRRMLVRALLFFGVAMLILALGKYGVAYVLLAELPVFRIFRCSCRYIVLVHLTMTFLACIALEDMLRVVRQRIKIPWRDQWPLLVPLAISLLTFAVAAWFLTIPHPGHPYVAQLRSLGSALMGLLVIAAAVALCMAVARGFALGVLGILLLTFAEIATAGLCFYIFERGKPVTPDELLASVAKPPSREGRVSWLVESAQGVESDLLAMAGYHCMEGAIHPPMLRLLSKSLELSWVPDGQGGGRVAISPLAIKSLQLAGVHWLRNAQANNWMAVPSPLPRVRLVAQAVVTEDEVTAFRTIDPATTAILDRPVGPLAGPPGSARLAVDRPGWAEIDAEAPGPQVLIWSERYHSGWTVTVNGQPVPLLRAYGDFMACPVGPGNNHVVLRFEPASFTWGLRISLLGLAASLAVSGLLCVPLGKRPRRTLAQWILGPEPRA